MRAVLVKKQALSSLCTTFWFKPDKPIRFNAGEFAEFYLPHSKMDDRGDKRWFTLCSSPKNELIEVIVKFAPAKSSTYKLAMQKMKLGDEIFIGETLGDFVLPKDPTIPLVFAAVGIGVTPMISIVSWLKDKDEQRDITLFHVTAKPEDLLAADLFDKHTSYHPLVKYQHPEWRGRHGMLTAAMIKDVASTKDTPFIYLAGPKTSVQELFGSLLKQGFSRDQIAVDLFTGAIDLPRD